MPTGSGPVAFQRDVGEEVITQSSHDEEFFSLQDQDQSFDGSEEGSEISLSDSDFDSDPNLRSSRTASKGKIRYRKHAYQAAKKGEWARSGVIELQSNYLTEDPDLA